MTVPSMYKRVFVYSATEENRIHEVHGNTAKLGTVSVRGIPKEYTSMIREAKDMPPDGIVVLSGDIRKIKYTTLTK